jgi:peroxiredoxin
MEPKSNPLFVIAIAALAVFSVFITWRAKVLEQSLFSGGRVASVGRPAPDFTLSTLDGRPVKLADYRGKRKLLVSFWASWCGPCRQELPLLREFYEKHHRPDSNFEVVAVSIDDEMAPARAYAQEAKLSFPVLFDEGQKVSTAYLVEGIPTMVLIDEYGNVVWGKAGFEPDFSKELEVQLGFAKPANPNGGRGSNSPASPATGQLK